MSSSSEQFINWCVKIISLPGGYHANVIIALCDTRTTSKWNQHNDQITNWESNSFSFWVCHTKNEDTNINRGSKVTRTTIIIACVCVSRHLYTSYSVKTYNKKKKNTYNSIDSAYFTEYQCILDHLFRSIQQSFAKNGSQARHSYSFDPVTIVRFFFRSFARLDCISFCSAVVCICRLRDRECVLYVCVWQCVRPLSYFQATTVPTAQKLKRITAACANHSLFFGIEIMKSNC